MLQKVTWAVSEFRKLLESFDSIERRSEIKEEAVGYDTIEEFQDCMEQIKELVEQAYSLIPRGSVIARRAESYWYNQILGTVDGNASMQSMYETLQELSEEVVDDPEFADDENGY